MSTPSESSRQLIVEICWWLFTAVLLTLVLLPIRSKVPWFPFFIYNAVYVVVAITMTRYLFTLHVSWLRRRFVLQALLAFLMIFVIFYMGQGMNEYITYLDNNGPDVLSRHLPDEEGTAMRAYLNTEYYFFGVWAIIAAGIYPFRMIFHIWKNYRNVRGKR